MHADAFLDIWGLGAEIMASGGFCTVGGPNLCLRCGQKGKWCEEISWQAGQQKNFRPLASILSQHLHGSEGVRNPDSPSEQPLLHCALE